MNDFLLALLIVFASLDRCDATLQLHIKDIHGNITHTSVEPNTTISELKTCIAERYQSHKDRVRLVFQGKLLEDYRNVSDCGMENDSYLHVVIRPVVSVMSTRVTIADSDGRGFDLQLNMNETIYSLKQRIGAIRNVTEDQQVLFLGRTLLEVEKTIEYYDIESSTPLRLVIHRSYPSMKVTVSIPDRFLTNRSFVEVKLAPNDSVLCLKQELFARTDIGIEKQVALFRGDLLRDNHAVSSYGIHNSSLVELIIRYSPVETQVMVRQAQWSPLIIDVHVNDTIFALKQKVRERSEIQMRRRALTLMGKQLEDNKTVADYGIEELPVLRLVLQGPGESTRISVHTDAGKEFALDIRTDEIVQNLKRRIEDHTGIAAKNQELYARWNLMDDGFALREYQNFNHLHLSVLQDNQ